MHEVLNISISTFREAQQSEIFRWLFEWKLYAGVAALILLGMLLPAERWTRKHWISTVHDFFYGLVHTIIWLPLLMVYITGLSYLTQTYLPWLQVNAISELPLLLQILIAAIVNDFLAYLTHYLSHKLRFLWHFHTIHHSQEQLNPFTGKRNHIVEHFFSRGFVNWIPLALMGSPTEVWLFYYLIDGAWEYFTHSNLRLNLGLLRWVFVSPQFHRLHHSKLSEHRNKNFGEKLVVWDLLFGTAEMNPSLYPPTGVSEPVPQEASLNPVRMAMTYIAQWCYPFLRCWRDTTARLWSSETGKKPKSAAPIRRPLVPELKQSSSQCTTLPYAARDADDCPHVA